MAPPFQILGIDHLVLRVRDLARMQRFYCEVLGCTLARDRPDLGLVHLRLGTQLIDLLDVQGVLGRQGGGATASAAGNLDHFCVRIEPFDEAVLRAHLAAHGATPAPAESRYGAEGTGLSLYFSDPEGNRIELKGRSFEPGLGEVKQ
jgi:glyoxylase I family protein